MKLKQSLFLFLILGSILINTSCDIHRLHIQQGNIVSDEMVKKLQIGMKKTQVKFVLGTPLLHNLFNPDRWDYVYLLRKNKGQTDKQRLTLFFEKDKLVRMEGDLIKPDAFDESDN